MKTTRIVTVKKAACMIGFAGLLLMAQGCTLGGKDAKAGDNGNADSVRQDAGGSVVSTAPVTEGVMNDELILNGSVACDESKVSKVFIPCSGKIQGVSVEVGDHVRRGQILADIFSQDAAEYAGVVFHLRQI